MTRRDVLFLVGKRASKLDAAQSAVAWKTLAGYLRDEAATLDVPKFRDLVGAIRAATIAATAPSASSSSSAPPAAPDAADPAP